MEEIEMRGALIEAWLTSWVEANEKPDWFAWFGCYPHKSSVNAAKAQLKAIKYGLTITNEDAIGIFNNK